MQCAIGTIARSAAWKPGSDLWMVPRTALSSGSSRRRCWRRKLKPLAHRWESLLNNDGKPTFPEIKIIDGKFFVHTPVSAIGKGVSAMPNSFDHCSSAERA